MLFSYDKTKGATQGFRNGFGVGGISFGDIGANKKTLDTGNNRKFLETLEYAQQKNKIPEGKFDAFAETEARILGDVDEKMVKLAKDTQTTQGSVIGLTKTFENQTSVTGKLSTSLKSIGGTLLTTLGNAAISMAVSTAISLFIKGVQDFIDSTEQLAQKTQEISNNFNSQKTTLSDYSNQIVSLKAVLDDETASTQEVQTATSQLYEIQNDLIGQYGSYHAGIDLINGDLETQLDLLGKINQENAQRALNDINAEKSNRVKYTNLLAKYSETAFLPGVGQGLLITDFLNNYFGKNQGFKKSVGNAFFESDALGNDVGSNLFGTSAKQIKDMVEGYNESFETTNKTVLMLAKNYKDAFEVSGNTITAKGNINDINDAVVGLQVQLQQLGEDDEKVFSSLSSIAAETSERMTTYGDSYNTILEGEIQSTGYLAKYYRDLTDKHEEFIRAQSTGDTEEVERIGKEYQELFANISQSDTDKKYIDYFKNLYPELQNYISQWEFDVKIKASLEGQSPLQEELQKLSDWGLGEYEDQITSGKLTKFGNIDMDKRAIIEWSDELKKTYQDELASWDYEPEVGGIDTVFGGSSGFNWDGKEHEIAFSPILQTDDGAVFLGKNQVTKYIDSVISQAAEDGNITADEILEIDAQGTGYQVGNNYVQGLIAGIDDNSGIAADKIGMLMHFSGQYGAVNLARNESSGLEILSSDLQRNSAEEIWSRYQNYLQASKAGADINKQTEAEFIALGEAAGKAGMGILDYINAVKSIPEYSQEMQHVRELMGQNFTEEFGQTLTDADLTALVAIEPKEDGLEYTKEEIEKILNPIRVQIEPELNSADAVNNLDKFRDTIGGLDTVYETTVTNKGIASASDLQGVNDSFGGVTFNQDVENTNALSNALEAYNDTLIKTPGNAEKAKEATNRLVTAYIDQSDTLQDLDKSTKQYHIDQLKSQGIENAEEVVVSRLSDTYKKFSKNLQTLSKSVAQYHDALQADESSDEFRQGANAIAKDLTKLFTTVGSNGEDITPNIDSSFVVANLDDIRAAAENDTDAIARLRVEAAKTIDLAVNVHDEQIYSAWNQISNMIANLDGTRFQIGGAMDDSAIIAALNNILSTGRYTVSEFQRMVSQISGGTLSAQVGWETKTVQFAAPTFSFADWKSQGGGKITSMNVGNYMKKSATFSMPKFSYKYNGSPTGAGARYSGGGGGGRSSGGGGGGGGGNSGGGGGSSSASEPNKPQEEAEDSFDWIEVAIQRIEEEIERLDKVVNNSYTTWTKRNSALAKELEKTKDEIKAQYIAQQEYIHYLGTIKVNNGKGLNADDYGENDQLVKQQDQRLLDEARRLWATGQYQRKIQNGQMTGNDIEKIQNHFLVDTINEYKEM